MFTIAGDRAVLVVAVHVALVLMHAHMMRNLLHVQTDAAEDGVEIITSDVPAASGPAPTAANVLNAAPGTGPPLHQDAAATGDKKQGSQHADGKVSAGGTAGAKAVHRQQHKKRKHQEQHWSSLSAEDHAWFLARQGAHCPALQVLSCECMKSLNPHDTAAAFKMMS